MCGIIGYIGQEEVAPILVDGLRKLEYRGYDSAGIAIKDSNKIKIIKDKGKINEVFNEVNLFDLKGKVGIGHTRWATHGKVNKKNSHPITDCSEDVVVVHNGIIENYSELKKCLIKKGHKFKSETDTEVISHLIEEHLKNKKTSFVKAFKKAIKLIKGSYAVVVIKKDENLVLCSRKNSPLVLGLCEDGFIVSSDVTSFLNKTKKVIYLENEDFVVLGKNKFSIHNKNKKVKRNVDNIEWDEEQAKKGAFKHFMIKEIVEQADVIERAISQDKEVIDKISKEIKKAKGIFFVGCGTAYHACLEGSYLFSKIAGVHVNVVQAHEFRNFVHFLNKSSLVIAVSQSGETADTLDAIISAKRKGAKIMSIVNANGSSVARASKRALFQKAGPEISVLSTKSYTSQLSILSLIAYSIAKEYEAGTEKLKDLIRHVYYLTSKNSQKEIKKVAKKLKNFKSLFVIGKGLEYPTALESALKIKEVSYTHAEGFAGGELKHGVIALIEKGTPCIVFTSKENEKRILGNVAEIKARGAFVIGVGPKNNELFDMHLKVREMDELNSICQVIPIQILAYQLAVLRGLDPDKPRNLAKSVTVS